MASAENRQTLTGDGTTNFKKIIGPVHIVFYGAFNGGTATVVRRDANGAEVDVVNSAKTEAADFITDYVDGEVSYLAVTLADSTPTSPLTEFIVEMDDGKPRPTS